MFYTIKLKPADSLNFSLSTFLGFCRPWFTRDNWSILKDAHIRFMDDTSKHTGRMVSSACVSHAVHELLAEEGSSEAAPSQSSRPSSAAKVWCGASVAVGMRRASTVCDAVVPGSELSLRYPSSLPYPGVEHQILRFIRLSTCVEAHWLRLHRVWIRLHRILRASVVVMHV